MSFLKRLFSFGRPSDQGIYVYVRCNRCGEAVRVRLDPTNDLSPTFEG